MFWRSIQPHLQGWKVDKASNQADHSLCWQLAQLALRPRSWEALHAYKTLENFYQTVVLHGVTSQKIMPFRVTSQRPTDPVQFVWAHTRHFMAHVETAMNTYLVECSTSRNIVNHLPPFALLWTEILLTMFLPQTRKTNFATLQNACSS
jgi:hypothetical protein